MTDDNPMNGAGSQVPDYMQGVGDGMQFGEGMDGEGFPRLAFKGSRFRLRQGGEETVLPETELDVIILKDHPAVSRLYYKQGATGEGEDNRPLCASSDGVLPLASVPNPPSDECKSCPMNEKGSAFTDDGRKARACGFYKRIVLLIKGYETVGPVIADIRSMSLFGDGKPDENQWSLKLYFARLRKHDKPAFQMITTLTFDLDESVPKILFSPKAYVPKEMFLEYVMPLVNTPDGLLALEDMSDTGKVRFEDAGDGGFRDKLLEEATPDHMIEGGGSGGPALPAPQPGARVIEEPQIPLEAQLAKAVADADFALAGELQGKINAREAEPVPKPEEPAAPTVAERLVALEHKLAQAIARTDFAGAAEIQERIKALTPEGASNPDPAPEAGFVTQPAIAYNDMTPEQKAAVPFDLLPPAAKAARTRAANKKKAEQLAASNEADPAPVPSNVTALPTAAKPPPEPPADDFDSKLQGVLDDFDF